MRQFLFFAAQFPRHRLTHSWCDNARHRLGTSIRRSRSILLLPHDAYATDMHNAICAPGSMTDCPSQATNKWIDVVFDTDAITGLSYTVLYGNLSIYKYNGTSVWNHAPNSELSRFFFCFFVTSTVASVAYRVRPSEVYHTKHPSLFTARRLYTAETCLIYGENSFAVVGDFQYVYAMIIPDQNNERRMLRIMNTVIAIIIWHNF